MSKKQRWLLPTNTENLELFLSQGLMTCWKGINGYIEDIMCDYPAGYIPLFADDNISEAIERSTEEDKNLTTCIIELDLAQINSIDIFYELEPISDNGNKFEKIDISELSENDE